MAVNIVPQTEDFSHATWASASVTVTTNTHAAPVFTGAHAGLADTVADNSAVAQGSLFEDYQTIVSDSSVWVSSIFVRKDSNTARFPEFDMQMAGGTGTYCGVSVNTQTGAIADSTDGAPDSKGVVDFDSLWWRVWFTKANNSTGNTVLRFGLFPARAVTIGGAPSATPVDSIIVFGCNQTNDATVQTYVPAPFYVFETPAAIIFTHA